jgi:triphosphatase
MTAMSAPQQEIEIKLDCPRHKVEAFLEHPLLHALDVNHRPERHKMVNIYYDTPDLLLRQSKVAIRLRRFNTIWMQTLKAPGKREGGLSSRKEWEMTVAGGALELDRFKGTDAEGIVKALREHGIDQKLVPLFRVEFERMAWMIRPFPRTLPLFRTEVVLDRGEIIAGSRRQAISEIEIELKHGQVKELKRVAEMLKRDVGLSEETASKARRGYALLALDNADQKAAALAP